MPTVPVLTAKRATELYGVPDGDPHSAWAREHIVYCGGAGKAAARPGQQLLDVTGSGMPSLVELDLPVDRADQRRATAYQRHAAEVDEEVGIGGLGGHALYRAGSPSPGIPGPAGPLEWV